MDDGDRTGARVGFPRWARTGVLLGTVLVVAAGCAAAGNDVAGEAGAPGFWLGLWHGLIAPITFLVSLFSDTVGIYAVRNSGAWYDFGFLLGLSVVFSGSGRAGAGSSGGRAASRRASRRTTD